MSILSAFKKIPKRDKYAEAKTIAKAIEELSATPEMMWERSIKQIAEYFPEKHDELMALAYNPTASLNDLRQIIGFKRMEAKMNKHNHYIAIYESFGGEYNNVEIITEKQFVEGCLNLNSVNGGGYCRCRFNFCPICGAVIDWDDMKQRQSEEKAK